MRNTRIGHWILILTAFAATPTPLPASTVELDGMDPESHHKADYDGNGCADLAVAAPLEDHDGLFDVGAVNVLYGTPSGFSSPGNFWHQGNLAVTTPEDDDTFGYSLAAGDFDGDGTHDLAIGVPGNNSASTTSAGLVQIIYGAPVQGLMYAEQYLHQNVGSLLGEVGENDQFGFALTSGDFNGDGYDDLAIGVPGEDFVIDDPPQIVDGAGSVQVVYGSAIGLSDSNDQLWDQEMLNSTAEEGDAFGSTLAAGDFDGDGDDELVIGCPEEDLSGTTDAGFVQILIGTPGGLQYWGEDFNWSQKRPGMPDQAEDNDQFGSALATGDFNRDGCDDLVIGVPHEGFEDLEINNAGAVHVLFGSPAGPTLDGTLFLSQGTTPVSGRPNEGDLFGYALASGDFNRDGYDDLAIGAPSEDDDTVSNTGLVSVLYGHSSGLGTMNLSFWQSWLLTEGLNELGDFFGATLVTSDFNGDRYDDLAIAAPNQDVDDVLDAGIVFVMYGTSGFLSPDNDVVMQGYDGNADLAEHFDRFGFAMAAVPMGTRLFVNGFEAGDTRGWAIVVP